MDSKDKNGTNGALLDDELKSLNSSEEDSSKDAINLLHQEITSLRKDRSELQAKISALLSEMEQSEVQTKAVAAHASYMEGELVKFQEDLVSASSLAEDEENEKKKLEIETKELRSEVSGLMEMVNDLEIEKERKDVEIRTLKEKVLALEEEKVALVTQIEADKKNEMTMASKEGELDGALKESYEADQKNREMNFAAANTMCSAGVNWGIVASAAASTGAVAVVATMLCLHQKQR